MPLLMAKAQAMVTSTSHDMYLLYLRALNIPVHAMMTVVTQTKKNMSNLNPGTQAFMKGSSPTVAPTIMKASRMKANQRLRPLSISLSVS